MLVVESSYLLGATLEPENITRFLYMHGSFATTLLFHESPLVKTVYLIEDPRPSHRGDEANKNPIILNLLLKLEAYWAGDQTDTVVQLFLTKLNHNYDAKLKWVFSAAPDTCRFRLQGLKGH